MHIQIHYFWLQDRFALGRLQPARPEVDVHTERLGVRFSYLSAHRCRRTVRSSVNLFEHSFVYTCSWRISKEYAPSWNGAEAKRIKICVAMIWHACVNESTVKWNQLSSPHVTIMCCHPPSALIILASCWVWLCGVVLTCVQMVNLAWLTRLRLFVSGR